VADQAVTPQRRLAARPAAVRPRLPLAIRPGALRAPGAAVWTAAGLALVAAWIHFAYTSTHWADWWAYGVFFLATGIFQSLSVPVILRWPRNTWAALVVVAGNLGIIQMYVYSRTTGVPMGPHEGVVERTGAVDLATTAGEIVLIALMLTIVGSTSRRIIVNLLLLVGIGLWLLRFTNLLA
jgi:hypothetical protein